MNSMDSDSRIYLIYQTVRLDNERLDYLVEEAGWVDCFASAPGLAMKAAAYVAISSLHDGLSEKERRELEEDMAGCTSIFEVMEQDSLACVCSIAYCWWSGEYFFEEEGTIKKEVPESFARKRAALNERFALEKETPAISGGVISLGKRL